MNSISGCSHTYFVLSEKVAIVNKTHEAAQRSDAMFGRALYFQMLSAPPLLLQRFEVSLNSLLGQHWSCLPFSVGHC